MIRTRPLLAAAWVVAALTIAGAAQEPGTTNPYLGDDEAIRTGMGLYRINCADCHGVDAGGVRGPDLRGVWASGRTDAGLFTTIRNGIPGTEMIPPRRARDDEIWKILAYLRTLAVSAASAVPTGDVANGQRIFRENCSGCHKVDGVGGRIGPDLSRVGVARSAPALVSRIREGSLPGSSSGYRPVTLTTQGGEAIRGVTKNEDMFSIQIMEVEGRIQGFDKATLDRLERPLSSVMPVFGPDRLTDSDLADLIGYLQTLDGFDPSVIPEQED